jgi:hypothetical protein
MSGAPDPQYVVARSVLLDALGALGAQREAVILVGAQAVYLHTGGTREGRSRTARRPHSCASNDVDASGPTVVVLV